MGGKKSSPGGERLQARIGELEQLVSTLTALVQSMMGGGKVEVPKSSPLGGSVPTPRFARRANKTPESGWREVARTKPKAKADGAEMEVDGVKAKAKPALRLRAQDWSMPIVTGDELKVGVDQVALVTNYQADTLADTLKGSANKICLVTPEKVNKDSVKFECRCTNLQDRLSVQTRWYTNVGVKVTKPAYLKAESTLTPKVNIVNKSVKVVLQMVEAHSAKAKWKAGCDNPGAHFRDWLKTTELWHETIYCFRPVRKDPSIGGKWLEQVLLVSASELDAFLRKSGVEGTFVREFVDEPAAGAAAKERRSKVVWLNDCDLEQSTVKMKSLGTSALGLAHGRGGIGIRVLNEQFDAVGKQLLGEDFVPSAKVFEVANVPLWVDPDELLTELVKLIGWKADFLRPLPGGGKMKRFLVKATADPSRDGVVIADSSVTIQPARKQTFGNVSVQVFAGKTQRQRKTAEHEQRSYAQAASQGSAKARTNALREAIGMLGVPYAKKRKGDADMDETY